MICTMEIFSAKELLRLFPEALLFADKQLGQHDEQDECSHKHKEADGRSSGVILVVDDEQAVARFISELLEMQGYTTEMVSDGESALELVRRSPDRYALIITDQAMPRLSGFELAEKVLEIREDMPMILCTGYSEQVDEETAKKAGIREFMLKPLDTRSLLAHVRELI